MIKNMHELSEEDVAKLRCVQVPVALEERERLILLKQSQLLDSDPHDEKFDRISRLCARSFKVLLFACCANLFSPSCPQMPVAAISLVDTDRVWLKSKIGLSVCEIDRNDCLCSFSVLDRPNPVLVIPDASRDPLYHHLSCVTGPSRLRFYAGAAIICEGRRVGCVCVADVFPCYDFGDEEQRVLQGFADVVALLIDKHRAKVMEEEAAMAKLVVGVTYRLKEPLQRLVLHQELLAKYIEQYKQDADCSAMDVTEVLLQSFRGRVEKLMALMEVSVQSAMAICQPQLSQRGQGTRRAPSFTSTHTMETITVSLQQSVGEKQVRWLQQDADHSESSTSSKVQSIKVNCRNLGIAVEALLTMRMHCNASRQEEEVRMSAEVVPCTAAIPDVEEPPHGMLPGMLTITIPRMECAEPTADMSVVRESVEMLCRTLLSAEHGGMDCERADGSMKLWVPCSYHEVDKVPDLPTNPNAATALLKQYGGFKRSRSARRPSVNSVDSVETALMSQDPSGCNTTGRRFSGDSTGDPTKLRARIQEELLKNRKFSFKPGESRRLRKQRSERRGVFSSFIGWFQRMRTPSTAVSVHC